MRPVATCCDAGDYLSSPALLGSARTTASGGHGGWEALARTWHWGVSRLGSWGNVECVMLGWRRGGTKTVVVGMGRGGGMRLPPPCPRLPADTTPAAPAAHQTCRHPHLPPPTPATLLKYSPALDFSSLLAWLNLCFSLHLSACLLKPSHYQPPCLYLRLSVSVSVFWLSAFHAACLPPCLVNCLTVHPPLFFARFPVCLPVIVTPIE